MTLLTDSGSPFSCFSGLLGRLVTLEYGLGGGVAQREVRSVRTP